MSFQLHPLKHDLLFSKVNPQPSLYARDDRRIACEKEYLKNPMAFPNGWIESSENSCKDSTYPKGILTFEEELQLQYLEKELGIGSYDSKKPVPKEIYEAQILADPTFEPEPNARHYVLVSETGDCLHLRPEVIAAHKQRIRWTPKLHELFSDAIGKLGAPDRETPKSILKLMNVEGVNSYHVKSHVQKYGLAKNMSELRRDTRNLKLEEKAARTEPEKNTNMNSNMGVVEALRMQIEMQKLLHEQLMEQKELQLPIEQQGEFLKKLMEEKHSLQRLFTRTHQFDG